MKQEEIEKLKCRTCGFVSRKMHTSNGKLCKTIQKSNSQLLAEVKEKVEKKLHIYNTSEYNQGLLDILDILTEMGKE